MSTTYRMILSRSMIFVNLINLTALKEAWESSFKIQLDSFIFKCYSLTHLSLSLD